MPSLADLKVKIFADGADLDAIRALRANPVIKGFTTNPTLMRAAGIDDYETFSKQVIDVVEGAPLSLEVFADDLDEMVAQARVIAGWGENVFVKIPVTNTKGESCAPIIKRLSGEGVQVNVTAVFSLEQVQTVTDALNSDVAANVSVFAGRIADTGVDPVPHMRESVKIVGAKPKAELIWASPRELLNLFHADQAGCQIITVTADILKKLALIGKDLDAYSLETVEMFRRDAVSAQYSIKTS
ncbi:MAG: transaldolase [Rhodospirillales bacterium]|nr:transaldolase [Rhodospirillales bacterium]MBO6786003.1 transaldolase [Rhodospirillales bacterium]